PDRCPKPRAIAVDPARRHREVLKIGSAIADRLQTGAMEEAGNVLRGDAPFGAERIAPAHFVRSEEVDVAFERRCRNRRETGVAVGGLQHGYGRKRTGDGNRSSETGEAEAPRHGAPPCGTRGADSAGVKARRRAPREITTQTTTRHRS